MNYDRPIDVSFDVATRILILRQGDSGPILKPWPLGGLALIPGNTIPYDSLPARGYRSNTLFPTVVTTSNGMEIHDYLPPINEATSTPGESSSTIAEDTISDRTTTHEGVTPTQDEVIHVDQD
jgi:hypothetical protein